MKNKCLISINGFSLLELVVVTALAGGLMLAVSDYSATFYKNRIKMNTQISQMSINNLLPLITSSSANCKKTLGITSDTALPITPGLLHRDGAHPDADPAAVLALPATVEVEIPDDHVDAKTGQIDKQLLRVRYKGSTKWDTPAPLVPILIDPTP